MRKASAWARAHAPAGTRRGKKALSLLLSLVLCLSLLPGTAAATDYELDWDENTQFKEGDTIKVQKREWPPQVSGNYKWTLVDVNAAVLTCTKKEHKHSTSDPECGWSQKKPEEIGYECSIEEHTHTYVNGCTIDCTKYRLDKEIPSYKVIWDQFSSIEDDNTLKGGKYDEKGHLTVKYGDTVWESDAEQRTTTLAENGITVIPDDGYYVKTITIACRAGYGFDCNHKRATIHYSSTESEPVTIDEKYFEEATDKDGIPLWHETTCPFGYAIMIQLGKNAPETKNITVTKQWGDLHGEAQPDNVTVTLFKGTREDFKSTDYEDPGKKVDEVVLNADNNWTHTFTPVKYDSDNNEIQYFVAETQIGGYEEGKCLHSTTSDTIRVSPSFGITLGNWIGSVEGSESAGYTITNDYTESTFSIKYQFVGDQIPDGVTPPVDNKEYKWEEPYTVASVPAVDGWTFDGWYINHNGVQFTGPQTEQGSKKTIDKTFWGNVLIYLGMWTKAEAPAHTHIWSEKWSSNSTHHWHECTAEGCDITDNSQKEGYAEHSGTDDYNCLTAVNCDACGYELTAAQSDHKWSGWTHNGTSHSRSCQNNGCGMTQSRNCTGGTATCVEQAVCEVCGEKYGELSAHSFTAETVGTDYLKSAATCTAKAVYYKSCAVCGLSSKDTANEATFASGEVDADGHTESLGDRQWDDAGHWREYSCCGAKAEEGEHVYDDDADKDCNICGYERTVAQPHTHSYGSWTADGETGHFRVCTAEDCPEGDKGRQTAMHDYDDVTDLTCGTCGYTRKKVELSFNYITAVGNGDTGNGSWLNGAVWDPEDVSNHMTQSSPNVYEIVYTGIAAYDNYWVKFAADNGWTDNWGAEDSESLSGSAVYNNPGINFSVAEDNSTVRIVLDLSKYDPYTKLGAVYSIEILPPVTGYATVTLVNNMKWEDDDSGYQMLLDADATAYGSVFPESGFFAKDSDASEEVYAQFEYKLPENADGRRDTENVVSYGSSCSIRIPAGVYDYCIVNPTPGQHVYITAIMGRGNDYLFEAGKHYVFTVSLSGNHDSADLTIGPDSYTVSFDANGGSEKMDAVVGVSGEYTLPECTFTAPEGMRFKGWSVSAGGPVISGKTLEITENTTLFAIWEEAPAQSFTVSFDSDGGSAVESQTVENGGRAAEPALPRRTGYTFVGWSLNGVTYDFDAPVTGNITLVAQWVENRRCSVCETDCPEDCEACRDIEPSLVNPIDGATYFSGDVIPVRWRICKNLLDDNDTAVISLIGSDSAETRLMEDAAISNGGANVLLKSVEPGTYTLRVSVVRPTSGGAQEIMHFDVEIFANGGTAIARDKSVDYEDNLTFDVRELFLFVRDCDVSTVTFTRDGGTGEGTLSGTTLSIASPGTFRIKALVPADAENDSVIPGEVAAVLTVKGYTVTFDSLGGSEVEHQYVAPGGRAAEPTAPNRAGYTFDGWYLNSVKYDFDTPVTENITLTAKWTRIPYSGGTYTPSYTVSVAKTEHGSVSVSPKSAVMGTVVTITVTPDKGYTLETLTVTGNGGNELKLTEKGGGKYTFTMPMGSVTVKAAFMEDNTMLNFFVDVKPGDYYYDAVLWAAQKGITSGTDAVHFSPNQPCTRAQIVTFLWRAAGSPVVNYAMNMTDVPENAYYAEAVRWALSEGITTGTTESTFSPNSECTRAQAVAFLFRSAAPGAVTLQELVSGFADADSVPGYALSAMNWALAEGVVQGDGSNLMPNSACTRAQIVTFLYRTLAK